MLQQQPNTKVSVRREDGASLNVKDEVPHWQQSLSFGHMPKIMRRLSWWFCGKGPQQKGWGFDSPMRMSGVELARMLTWWYSPSEWALFSLVESANDRWAAVHCTVPGTTLVPGTKFEGIFFNSKFETKSYKRGCCSSVEERFWSLKVVGLITLSFCAAMCSYCTFYFFCHFYSSIQYKYLHTV